MRPCDTLEPTSRAPRRTTAQAIGSPRRTTRPGGRTKRAGQGPCHVLVIDSGAAKMDDFDDELYNAYLADVTNHGPDEASDGNLDDYVDPVAGHGTFIGGLFGRMAPGTQVVVAKCMSTFGDITDADAALAITEFVAGVPQGEPIVVSMSFRGYVQEDDLPIALAAAINEVVLSRPGDVTFVASAGNDASCRPTWPAAIEHVVGVGALGPSGPAPFTNYGPHVRACAPGVDVVSTFRGDMDPDRHHKDANPASDLADYQGWACWSGTSFAAPIVGAELAWEVMTTDQSLQQIVERRIKDEGLTRIAGLGTIVNVC